MISFDVNRADQRIITEIAKRAERMAAAHQHQSDRRKVMDYVMDITACHANGCPLDLIRLLAADDFNFAHDVFGIEWHLDRIDTSPTGGQLLGEFLPRFARKAQHCSPTDSIHMKRRVRVKRKLRESKGRRRAA
jgi:hypothetical protein